MIVYKITNNKLTTIENKFNVTKVEPVIGSELNSKFYFEKIVPTYLDSGELITPAEFGCVLSHMFIYKLAICRERSAIIFEKDISTYECELDSAIKFCQSTQLDFIHLGWHPQVRQGINFWGKFDQKVGAFRVDPFKNFFGAFSYFVSLKAAKEIVSFHEKMLRKADHWSEFFRQASFPPYFLPFFEHPFERGEIQDQRNILSRSRVKLSPNTLHRYAEKKTRHIGHVLFEGYRPLSKEYVARYLK